MDLAFLPPLDIPQTPVPHAVQMACETPDIDFETFSSAGYLWDAPAGKWRGPPNASQGKKGLFVVGAAVYAEHPSTEVLSCWYDLKDGRGRRFWRPGLPLPLDLFAHILAGGVLEAHNKGFESHIWRKVCTPKYGWPGIPAHQWRCSMAKARAHQLPGALDKLGDVLQIEHRKDKEGGRLLDKFSMPRNPTKGDPRHRIYPVWSIDAFEAEGWYLSMGYDVSKFPKDWRAVDWADTVGLSRYNERDIVAEAEASILMPDLPPAELQYWQVDQAINERGAHVDGKALHDCIAIVDQCLATYNAELQALTGGAVDRASELAKLSDWLRAQGVPVRYGKGSTDDDAMDGYLALPDLPPHARRALEIRKAAGSASVKKVFAMRNQLTSASRLHDLFSFHGARTGRPTGNGPQPTNLPSGGPPVLKCLCGRHHGAHVTVCPWCKLPGPPDRKPLEWSWEAAADALDVIAYQRLDLVELVFGQALATVGGCLRGLYCASPGNDLISSDYSAIEAVILAFLAREQWRMDVFNTHGKIYEASAAQMFGLDLAEMLAQAKATGVHHPLRKKGKVAELACFGPDTQVLTHRGYSRIMDVSLGDMLWDGKKWVRHQGVVFKGKQRVLSLDGVKMTPRHKVLSRRSWLAAKRLDSEPSYLARALATGSANLPLTALNWATKEDCAPSGCGVPAGLTLTPSTSPTCEAAQARGATGARKSQPARSEKPTSNMRKSSQTGRTESACSIAYRRRLAGATAKKIQPFQTTAAEASTCGRRGAPTDARSWRTSRGCRAGMTQASTWTGKTLTGGTSRATSDLSPGRRIRKTAAKSRPCKPASLSWSNVYDIANAGALNRFTIKTDSGHLIVHNCGYQGWVGASKQFGMPGTDEEIKEAVLKWRAASPAIEWLWGGQTQGKANGPLTNSGRPALSTNWKGQPDRWDDTPYYFGVEGAAVLAVLHPGSVQQVVCLDGSLTGVTYHMDGGKLYCTLPSGRRITYHTPSLRAGDRGGYSLSFWGYNTNPKNGPIGWIQMDTWGGRLVENIVQGIGNCFLRAASVALEEAGYPLVLHVYDEIVCDVPKGFGSVEEVERIMALPQPWAPGWPIKAAGGWRGLRYRKG